MVKLESNMLVLDASFTKDDAEAINHFVEIAKRKERDHILDIINEYKNKPGFTFDNLIHMIES